MYFVWTRISNSVVENFPLYLLLGIVIYNFFNELILLGQNSLLEKAHIILKVNFSRQIAVLSSLFTAFVNFLINLILVIVILVISKVHFDVVGILYFVFTMFVLFLIGLAVSLYASILTVKFRDLKNIFELAMFLLYWATPIFYTLDSGILGNKFSSVLELNPLGIVINQARFALNIYGEFDYKILVVFGISLLFTILGWFYFSREVKKVAEHF
jgi:ABC-type polysaccharide/polyol phosphate export permease